MGLPCYFLRGLALSPALGSLLLPLPGLLLPPTSCRGAVQCRHPGRRGPSNRGLGEDRADDQCILPEPISQPSLEWCSLWMKLQSTLGEGVSHLVPQPVSSLFH